MYSYRNSFIVKPVYDWNKLCDAAANAKTFDSFKTAISKNE